MSTHLLLRHRYALINGVLISLSLQFYDIQYTLPYSVLETLLQLLASQATSISLLVLLRQLVPVSSTSVGISIGYQSQSTRTSHSNYRYIGRTTHVSLIIRNPHAGDHGDHAMAIMAITPWVSGTCYHGHVALATKVSMAIERALKVPIFLAMTCMYI
jgi:hypothetical protein